MQDLFSADAILMIAAAQGCLGDSWSRITAPSRDPFRGIYQFNAFDLAIMIPYFLVLGVLAAYGFHRYWLVYCYSKHCANVPAKPSEPANWPKVTIQLPIYNERYVVERKLYSYLRPVGRLAGFGGDIGAMLGVAINQPIAMETVGREHSQDQEVRDHDGQVECVELINSAEGIA